MLDINETFYDEAIGEINERKLRKFIDELKDTFSASPEGRAHYDRFPGSFLNLHVEYVYQHFGSTLAEMEVSDLAEILFVIFPQKVSIQPDEAPAVIAELRAFFTFLEREYSLSNARKLLDYLRPSVEERMEEELGNPANFGPAKTFAMAAMASGVDLTNEAQMNAFMQEYNSRIVGRRAGGFA